MRNKVINGAMASDHTSNFGSKNYIPPPNTYSGEASQTFGHANANFSVFIDRIRIDF